MSDILFRPLKTVFLALALSTVHAACQTRQAEFQQHVQRAVQAQSASDIQTAISEYRQALAIQPDEAEVWANLGLMQHQSGAYSAALATFATAHRLQPRLFVPVLFLGLENLELGHPTEAVTYLVAAKQINPKDPNVSLYLGRAYFSLKRFDDSASSYLEAVKVNPANGETWYRLGISYLEVAETNSGTLSALNRHSPYFQALEADSFSRQDKLGRAIQAYRNVIASTAKIPCLHASLGLALLREDQLAEARDELQNDRRLGCSLAEFGLMLLASALDPNSVSVDILDSLWRRDPGSVLTQLSSATIGMPPERLATIDDAISKTRFPNLTSEDIKDIRDSLHGVREMSLEGMRISRPPAATASSAADLYQHGQYRACTDRLSKPGTAASYDNLSTLAACSYLTGDFIVALSTANKLRRIHPAEEEALYWTIRASQSLAVACLVRAGRTEPDSLRIHNLLAESYRDMGNYLAAQAEYAQSLRLNPNDFTALLGAAANDLQVNRIENASEMIRRALAQSPSDPDANYITGEVLVAQHKFDEAEPYLKLGLHAKAQLVPRVHALLGSVYASLGDDTEAIAEIRQGLSSDDDGSLYFQLGRLYQKTGQHELAEAAFEKTRQIKNNR